MCKNLLSKKMYEYLSWHASEIEKNLECLLNNNHHHEKSQESITFESFLKDYLKNITHYLNNTEVGADGENSCPFVIIGSTVDVYDNYNMEDEQYHIVLPYSKQHNTTIDCASCLSPLGKSLLFKGIQENVQIQIPTGVLNYTINKITVP